jgi:hypothetical protein
MAEALSEMNVNKLKGKDYSEGLDVNEEIILLLTLLLEILDCRVQTGFIWLRIWVGGAFL